MGIIARGRAKAPAPEFLSAAFEAWLLAIVAKPVTPAAAMQQLPAILTISDISREV